MVFTWHADVTGRVRTTPTIFSHPPVSRDSTRLVGSKLNAVFYANCARLGALSAAAGFRWRRCVLFWVCFRIKSPLIRCCHEEGEGIGMFCISYAHAQQHSRGDQHMPSASAFHCVDPRISPSNWHSLFNLPTRQLHHRAAEAAPSTTSDWSHTEHAYPPPTNDKQLLLDWIKFGERDATNCIYLFHGPVQNNLI